MRITIEEKPATVPVKYKRYDVHVQAEHVDRPGVVFNAVSLEHAERLSQAIDECIGWAIE